MEKGLNLICKSDICMVLATIKGENLFPVSISSLTSLQVYLVFFLLKDLVVRVQVVVVCCDVVEIMVEVISVMLEAVLDVVISIVVLEGSLAKLVAAVSGVFLLLVV